ncbi:DNA polymerase delta, subunit 4-domain-containing protein [Trametes polyzona]|nr:DNA polymerase delta, subunit 4-domain-containing protein [Trametes polyzona]
MSSRKNSKQSATMKQAKLSFTSKRHSSTANAATGKQAKSASVRKAASRTPSTGSNPAIEPITVLTSDSDVSFNDDYVVPAAKKRRLEASRGSSVKKVQIAEVQDEEPAVEPLPERQPLDLADKRWRSQFGVAREKMGHLEPSEFSSTLGSRRTLCSLRCKVHAQGQSMVHHILRVFDLSYEYGPCVGVSRLDRWERAHALGLNPPLEVCTYTWLFPAYSHVDM